MGRDGKPLLRVAVPVVPGWLLPPLPVPLLLPLLVSLSLAVACSGVSNTYTHPTRPCKTRHACIRCVSHEEGCLCMGKAHRQLQQLRHPTHMVLGRGGDRLCQLANLLHHRSLREHTGPGNFSASDNSKFKTRLQIHHRRRRRLRARAAERAAARARPRSSACAAQAGSA